MRLMRSFLITIAIGTLVATSWAVDAKPVPLGEVAQHAVEQSKITSPGSPPFHLKAKIVETTNPSSDYKAEVEEYWVAPDKWRRTITAKEFSQTLVVNADKISEQNTGDYYPWWLNDLVTAIFDPVPILDSLKNVNAAMQKPNGSTSCSRLQTKVGTPSAENNAFLVFCFEGSHGLLESIVTPGYDAEFKDYRYFKNKRVARRFVVDPEPGTKIEATVTELSALESPDEGLFTVQQSTPPSERVNRVRVSEPTARGLLTSWPDILGPRSAAARLPAY